MITATIPCPRWDPGNSLARAYLERPEEVLPLFAVDYRDPRHVERLLERQRRRPRPSLREALVRYNREVGGSVENAARIDDAFCVVSGQQVGLLLGPAYTAYKIITLLNAARVLEEALGGTVVPVFWVESEDHDWEEVNRFHWKGRRFRIEAAVPARTPVARVEADPEPFLTAVRVVLAAAAEAWAIVEPPERRIARWHVRSLARLFEGSGLVFVEASVLREPLRPLAERIVASPDAVDAALLRDTGHPRILTPPAGAYLFEGGETRRRLGRGEPLPEAWSTDVVSRVLLQNAALPVLAAVCGPAEIQYWAQLKGAHEALEVELPAVLPRDSATLVEEGLARDAARAGLDLEAVVRGLATSPEADAADPVAQRLRRLAGEAAELRQALESGSLELPPNTDQPFRRTVTRLHGELEKLAGRLDDARAEAQGAGRRRHERVLSELRPRGGPQERTHSLFPYLVRHGTDLVRRLAESFDPYEFGHYLVQL
jgi:uncharacterized protein YllA (UPF0747 family)